MWKIVDNWPALKSLIVSLVARCASIKQKSANLSNGTIGPVLRVTLGIIVDPVLISRLVRTFGIALMRSMHLENLCLVWINAPDTF